MTALEEKDILKRIIQNDALFRDIQVINQKFEIIPSDKEHYGVYIDYQDIQELRKDFVKDLIDTIVDWVYSSEKFFELKNKAIRSGKSEAAANSAVIRKAKEKFRGNKNAEELLIQGQLGELLLFNFIQRFMKAVPLLRKMKITTSSKHERFGADAIHFKIEKDKNIIILGEAKTYTSDYSFNKAFEDAQQSILNTYRTHKDELSLYLHEDFLDKEMNEIAESYLNKTMQNIEIHLVSIVTYNELSKLKITDQADIRHQIEEIICNKYKGFDNKKIEVGKNPILKRITYIVFPVWELENLAREFQNYI